MPEPIRDAVVVVPLYNEEQVIGDVVTDLHRRFPTVVCIDDGSTDGSIEVARRVGALVLEHAVNLGQGAALQTGMSYAWRHTDARYVVTFDADGQHQVDDAADMIDRAREKNLAIVFGSRFLDDRTDPGFMKKLVLAAAVRVTNATTGLRLTDAHNGLRVIRRDAGEQIELTQDRMAHASEIVADLGKTGLPWAEHPVHVLYTDYSRAKGQSVLNGVNILVDLLFH
ncbi:glycosyltransferase family 2 protein [Salana multivorans]